MSPTQSIAKILNVSEAQAIEYCNRTRAAHGSPLKYKIIESYLRENANLKSAELAKLIKRNPPSFVPTQTKRQKKRTTIWVPPQKNFMKLAEITKRKMLNQEKGPSGRDEKTTETLPHLPSPEAQSQRDLCACPHNIPLVRPYAICDPVRFRRQHGWE